MSENGTNESVTATLDRAVERIGKTLREGDAAAEKAEAELADFDGDKRSVGYRMLKDTAEAWPVERALLERDAERLARLAITLGKLASRPRVHVKTMGLPTQMTRFQAEALRWAVQNSDPL